VSLLRHIASELAGEQREQLEALGITVVDGPVAAVESDDGKLTGPGSRTAPG
jgi:hypothetical protein